MGSQAGLRAAGLFLQRYAGVMARRALSERHFDASRLVVAKPGWLGRSFAAGDRFRPEHHAISERRVRQLFDMRALMTDDEYQRLSATPVREPEPEGDWIDALDRDNLFEHLRELGHDPGPASKDQTLRRKLREALA